MADFILRSCGSIYIAGGAVFMLLSICGVFAQIGMMMGQKPDGKGRRDLEWQFRRRLMPPPDVELDAFGLKHKRRALWFGVLAAVVGLVIMPLHVLRCGL